MKYALLMYEVGEAWEALSEDERDAVYGEYFAVGARLGVVGGERLQPVERARAHARRARAAVPRAAPGGAVGRRATRPATARTRPSPSSTSPSR